MTGSVVVVGAGPRGTSVVERISANWAGDDATELVVHLVDPAPAGGGRVWRHDQPAHLLMNTLCADATHFTDDTVVCDGPITPGPNLYEWARAVHDGEIDWDDPELADECARVQPHSHPSRRLLGAYLRWCHLQDLAALPPGLTVQHHVATVVDARPGDHWDVELSTGERIAADAVVLCNGHVDLTPSAAEASRIAHAARTGAWYGLPANPLDQDLSAVAPGEPIVMRGLGMNFFDYLSMLTIGRGGRFVDAGSGRLRYQPSGAEPQFHVGSRRGIPYRAKGVFGTMTPKLPMRYLTREVVDRLAARPGVDFAEEMWPLIAKDAARTYYEVLARVKPGAFAVDPAEVLAALDRHDWGDPELVGLLAAATDPPLDFTDWERPLDGHSFDSPQQFTDWWLADLDHDLSEALRGMDSPFKCASLVLGQGRGPLRRMVSFGGIRGHSYDRDVEPWFRAFAGSLASGPPARRIAELIALTESGLVQPLGPDLRTREVADGFEVDSPAVAGSAVVTKALLEAHLPPNRLQQTADPLLARLRDQGAVRPYRMPDPRAGEPFTTGAVEVGRSPYPVVRADGTEDDSLYAFGVPVEHLHYGTQLGPLARTNSQFLRDSDAIARAVIGRVAGDDSLVPDRSDTTDDTRTMEEVGP